jgi:hypothetical protein
MNILLDAYHDVKMLLLNFHPVWRSYAPIKSMALNMLFIAYLVVYYDILGLAYQMELKSLW